MVRHLQPKGPFMSMRLRAFSGAACAMLAGNAHAAALMSEGAMVQRMSLEELANVEVTSASKSTQPLSEAAAALYVISHDDIVRSGVQSLPEALRLAPNLQVTQLSVNNYMVARAASAAIRRCRISPTSSWC